MLLRTGPACWHVPRKPRCRAIALKHGAHNEWRAAIFLCKSVLAALIPATPHEAVSNVPKAAQANERNPGARGHELRSQPGREIRPVDEIFVRGKGDCRARLSWLGRWLGKVHIDHPAVAGLCAGDHIPAACRTVKDGPAHDCDANKGWCNERCRALLLGVFSARLPRVHIWAVTCASISRRGCLGQSNASLHRNVECTKQKLAISHIRASSTNGQHHSFTGDSHATSEEYLGYIRYSTENQVT